MHAGQGNIQGLADRRVSALRNHFFSWRPACLRWLSIRSPELCQFESVSWSPVKRSGVSPCPFCFPFRVRALFVFGIGPCFSRRRRASSA